MDDHQRARVRINLAQGEVEVEGSEAFVRGYAARIAALLDRLDDVGAPAARPVAATPPGGNGAAERTFGEILQALPRAASDVDRILLAGHHAQSRHADRSFATGDANALLTEQGVKVGNPSQCVKQNLIAKRVFKHQGRYRVSQQGVDHLRQLLGAMWAE